MGADHPSATTFTTASSYNLALMVNFCALVSGALLMTNSTVARPCSCGRFAGTSAGTGATYSGPTMSSSKFPTSRWHSSALSITLVAASSSLTVPAAASRPFWMPSEIFGISSPIFCNKTSASLRPSAGTGFSKPSFWLDTSLVESSTSLFADVQRRNKVLALMFSKSSCKARTVCTCFSPLRSSMGKASCNKETGSLFTREPEEVVLDLAQAA
mmetsp:Transcript_138031/g.385055  ORF Transcript_138031/g.385055 Transcript_138031/m.385055 type:complete len:214 (-) Transcript_138031:118-759(-)